MSKNLKLVKRIAAVATTVCVVAGLMVSASAYGITEPVGGFTYDGTQASITVPVTGTSASGQVTIVVRKDNDNWLTDPNSNVIFIDQVTGAEGTTSITFGIDPKWASQGGLYKIFVGGSSQTPVAANFIIGEGIEQLAAPTGVEAGKTYYAAPIASIAQNTEGTITIAVAKNGGAFANVTVTNGNYTFAEDGAYVIKAVDTAGAAADSATVSFTVAAASVTTYANKVTAITSKSSWTAAEVASIDGLISEYNGFVADKKTAVNAVLGNDFVETLNNIKAEALEVALAGVFAKIDALPAASEVTEGDATVIAALADIDADIATVVADWGNVDAIVNAYADGKLPAVRAAVKVQTGAEATLLAKYAYSFDLAGKAVVEVSLSEGAGTKKIMVGADELFYSVQRQKYVGIIDAANVSGEALANVVITDETPTPMVYGNVNASTIDPTAPKSSITTGDLLVLKMFMGGSRTLDAKSLIQADVSGDGSVKNGDVIQIKLYLGNGTDFAILSK
ncbi:MAG: hypothetical protein PHE51_10705 [Eubacteriales bacterium]|nr:hypothetical protein [Eubacteriales bacterium]